MARADKLPPKLPPVTIIIEWENAIDVYDEWVDKAMAALQRELESVQGKIAAKPRVTYLYDDKTVDPEIIRKTIARAAPRLPELAELEIEPAPGLTYYKLKNYGVSRSKTEITVMVDSDAGPQPGWLENILKPFEDPEIMVAGGFTVLGHNDLLSRTMALSWIFDLPEERSATVKRHKVHVNNCAVRTAFFNQHPFPDLGPGVFKKSCGFWLRDLDARGHKYVRTAEAMTVHAPHPGVKFLVWRAWTGGKDRDYLVFQEYTRNRIGRAGMTAGFALKKIGRAWKRIVLKGGKVDLPVWQRPAAMALAAGFYLVTAAAGVTSALTRSFEPLPKRPQRQRSHTKRVTEVAKTA
ncbi:MAG: glycosyltransferase [Sphingomicrobium sp.]